MYTAKLSGGKILTVLSIKQEHGEYKVTHKIGYSTKRTLLRQDAQGCHYFHAAGQRVYLADCVRM